VHHLNLQLNQKIDQLMSLPETCVTALSIVDLKGLLQVTLRILINFAKLDRAGIFLLDDEGKFLELHTGVGIEPALEEKVQGYKIPVTKLDNIIARVAINGIPVVISDVSHSRLNQENLLIKLFQPQAFVLAPITVRGKVLGVIMADRIHQNIKITEQDKDFVVNFANQIAIALDNAILHRKLEISERRYKEMVENAHEGIWIIDERGIIKFVNRRLREITGQKELEGRKVFSLFARDDRRLLGNILSRNRRGQVVQQELEINSKERGLVSVILSSVPLTENGQFLGAFAMISDISELKKMERQLLKQQKMEAVVTLAEGISRYFNDVLVNIMVLNGLLLSETDPSQPGYNELKQIEQEMQRGAELSQQLLSIGNASSFEPKPMDTNGLIEKTIKLFLLSHQEITFSNNLAPNLPPVEVDQGQFEQILINLMLLARSTISGQKEVRVSTEEIFLAEDFCRTYGRPPGRYVYISLNYPGKVIDEQTKARIYEPVITSKEISPDHGLGLISVYAIIKNHGGIIELDSETGQGSTFHIYLPVTSKSIVTEERPTAAFVRGSGTLLLVDDDETVRSLGTRMLERLGYQVIPAENGQHALAIYRNQKDRIDLVILDMIMPDMSGRETYQQLQQIDPQVKVLLYSGHSMDEDVHLVLEKGALGFIQKPYRIANLSQKIADLLQKPPATPRLLPLDRESGTVVQMKRVGQQ
jgi:PAS domain S-box-containing protein